MVQKTARYPCDADYSATQIPVAIGSAATFLIMLAIGYHLCTRYHMILVGLGDCILSRDRRLATNTPIKMQPVFRSLHFQEIFPPTWLQSEHNWEMEVSDDAFARLMAEVYAASLEQVT
jgi:hypothetical protein